MKRIICKGLMFGNLAPLKFPPLHPSPARGEGGAYVAGLAPPCPLVGTGGAVWPTARRTDSGSDHDP
jgi:hypothetical protein